MQNLENVGVFEIFITQKLLKCPKDPLSDLRSMLIINDKHPDLDSPSCVVLSFQDLATLLHCRPEMNYYGASPVTGSHLPCMPS